MKCVFRATALTSLCLLTACSFAPTYRRPDLPAAPDGYKEAAGWKVAEPADSNPRGSWWTVFGDSQLNALEAQVAGSNQNLKAAYARFEQARAQARQARADYFPTVGVAANATRQRQSTTRATSRAGAPSVYNDYFLDADLSYEIDVWGRVRNAAEAGKDTAQASAADLAEMDLATHAELAMDYFSLRADDSVQALLDQTVDAYGKALQLTQNLHQGGAASAVDVDQAQTQLQTAKTQAAETQLRRAQLEHAIAVLIGVPPSQFSLKSAPLTAIPQPINPGLPSRLLERRPDIAAAERRTAAANAEIGVARVAYFPEFSLAAVFGFESGQSSSWLTAPSRLWSLGPSALFTVFDGGRRAALSDQARAAYDEAVANYRQTVLNAYQDVEDNLAAQRQLEQESASQQIAVDASQRALTQATYRYKGGITTYLEVVSAQNAALQAQLSAANILARRMNADVLLIKALGGGWSNSQLDHAASTSGSGTAEIAK